MRRPLPQIPRGRRRSRQPGSQALLLACPRVAPDWELAALRALVKPQFKDRILHRASGQKWPPDAAERVAAAQDLVEKRLGYQPVIHLPDAGDFFLIAQVKLEDSEAALGLALLLSRRFPGIWWTFDRLFIRDGEFFRQRPGRRFQLLRAAGVHLKRPVRAALRNVL